MFDNLKEKLGSFRKDAEEAAEENVEEVDEESAEALEEEPVDETGAEPTDLEETPTAPDEPEPASEPAAPDTTDEPVGESDVDDRERELGTTTEPTDATADETARRGASPTESTENAEPTPASGLEQEPADAESTVEEPDEPAEPAEPETDVESIEEGAPATVEETDTEPTDDEDAVDAASPAPEAEAEPDADAGEAETEDDDDDDAGGPGFGAKARSLVKGKFVIEEEDLEEPLHELEMALLTSDVEMGVAEEICDNVRDELVGETRTFTTSTGEVVEEALQDAIYDVISVGQFDFDERIAVEDKPAVLLFTGVNGVGKTTTIAKMSRYLEQRGYSTVLANGDTYRAGANQQIQQHADALDTNCISHEQGGDPAAVLYDAVEYAEAHDVDVVLADTAGRLHTDEGLMDQLEKIDRVVGPDMTLFVDEAVAGQDAVNRAREFNEAAAIDGAILSKADADSNGGAAISIAHVTGKPILFLGVGQEYDDLERFDPDEMVDRLLAEDE